MTFEKLILTHYLNERECEIQRQIADLAANKKQDKEILTRNLSILQEVHDVVRYMDIPDNYHLYWKLYHAGWRP